MEEPIEGRVAALEKDSIEVHAHLQRHDEHLAEHDRRITAHGQETDRLHEDYIKMQAEDRHRDDAIQRIESKIDTQSGKVDSILMQPAKKWNDAVWLVVAALIGAAVSFAVGRLGLS